MRSAPASITRVADRLVLGRNAKNGLQSCHFIAGAPSPPFLIVLLSKSGLAIRQLPDAQAAPSQPSGLVEQKPRGGGTARNDRPSTRHCCRRAAPPRRSIFKRRAPLAASRIAKSSMHPSGEVDLALALDGGLLAGGWFHAPSSAFAGIDYVKEDGTAVPLDGNSYKFPAWAQGKDEKSKTDVTGFVAWIPLAESSRTAAATAISDASRFRSGQAADTEATAFRARNPTKPRPARRAATACSRRCLPHDSRPCPAGH